MNDMTIGMENLPNVFIDKITIYSNVIRENPRRIQYNMDVVVKMYDRIYLPSWRNTLEGLKVKCSFITDDRIQKLNNGELSLYDIPTGAVNRTIVDACDNFAPTTFINGHQVYQRVFSMSIINPENLNVYVSCFIDDLGFGIPQFDKFYGPMAAEKIFVGGETNKESGYFYKPETNEEYGGPVHRFEDRYMEGSQHSQEPHENLRFVEEENYKIIEGTPASGADFSVRILNNTTPTQPNLRTGESQS